MEELGEEEEKESQGGTAAEFDPEVEASRAWTDEDGDGEEV